jgi:hypothetical protein
MQARSFAIILLLAFQTTRISEASAASKDTQSSGDQTQGLGRGCEIVVPNSDVNKITIFIQKSGTYCLDRDYTFTCTIFHHGCSGQFILIEADDVELDMKGHSLSGGRAYTGVYAFGRNISIRNGVLKGLAIGVEMGHGSRSMPYYARPGANERKKSPFATTNFHVENMIIQDADYGILLGGAGNVIRDNKLTCSLFGPVGNKEYGKVAKIGLMNYGSNVLIENNEIEMRSVSSENRSYGIYLRNATDSILKGNEISITGDGAKIGLEIYQSRNVKLRDNVLPELEFPIMLDEESSIDK